MTDGTPKTVLEAILNGLEEAEAFDQVDDNLIVATVIQSHVRDFLAQKFTAKMVTDSSTVTACLSKLWLLIFPPENGGQ